MDSALTTVGLPLALAIIMFGLGLDLTIGDFKRVGRAPKAVGVALACQILLLPAICFGLVVLFDLPALLGIGMLLLAASPGGTTANLFSHLFKGDVALNITLTAINTVIAVVTLPLITGLAIAYFDRQDDVSMPLVEIVKVFALILAARRHRHAGQQPGARLRATDGQAGAHRVGGDPRDPGARHPARPARERR